MIYLNVLGQGFLILSSLEIATDLFEKRSLYYSDRKQMTMLNELYVSHSFRLKLEELIKIDVRCGRMDGVTIMSLMPYGTWWRRHRRLFQESFHRNAITKYQPLQRQEVQAFLRRLLVTPDNFFHHIRQ
jgi:cytochrome P450